MDVGGGTDLLAILGDPLAQARTPGLVNAELDRRGRDAVLVPMRVRRGELAAALAGLRVIGNFRGAVVTMPHKSAVVPLLDDVTPAAHRVGACNAVRRGADGRLAGAMYDGEAMVSALRAAGHEVRGRRVFLAGAGGAASAIAFAVAAHGAAALTVWNRTAATAEALAARVRADWPGCAAGLGGPSPAGHDVVVNATSLGMAPGDALPVDPAGFAPGMVAADAVIRAEPTPFLAAAGARGCATQPGLAMLAAQIGLLLDFILA